MNRFQKKILTIAAGLLNIGLALSAAAVATYAWFAMEAVNINVTDKAATIAAQDPGDQMQYEIYKYDDNLKAGKLFTNPSDFTLPDYDKYITEKNIYANAIVRAEITLTEPLLTSNYEFSIDITRLASDFLNDGKIGRYTSNVVQFKATLTKFQEVGQSTYTTNTASHNNIDETSPATKYATASEYFRNRSTPTTFVPIRYYDDGAALVTRDDEASKRTISLIPPLDAGYEINKVVMYLECSYHDTLVDKYVETNASEGSVKYALNGDISKIDFSKRAKVAGESHATGKYIRVESDQGLQNGQTLIAYNAGNNTGKIFKASLVTSANSTLPHSTGHSANNNVVDVNVNSTPSPVSIESTDEIDENSLEFNKSQSSFKSKAGYYIGNHESASNKYGIESSQTYSSGFENHISFASSKKATIYNAGNAYRFRYNNSTSSGTTQNRFNYYASTYNTVELFRYTENVAEMPTLVSIAITHNPNKTTFYVGQKFSVTGLIVTATYSDGSTANVTGGCTYSLISTTTKTISTSYEFKDADVTASAQIRVNYTEGGVTIATANRPRYNISILAEELDHLTKATGLTNVYYYIGDTFSAAGLKVNAVYNSGRVEENVQVSLTSPDMSTAGTKTITASYGGKDLEVGPIYVRAKALSIDTTSQTIDQGDDFNITVTYNQDVTITQSSNDGGSVTLDKVSITYSGDKSTTTSTVNVTGANAGTVTVTFSSPGVASVTCIVTVEEKLNVTDEINRDKTISHLGSSSTSSWVSDFNITGESGAVYHIHSMGLSGDSTGALRWNSNGYLYATGAANNNWPVVSITATTNKTITVYGSNTAFSSNSGGTLIGSITSSGNTLVPTTAYKFLRIVGTDSSTSVTSISILYGSVNPTGVTLNKNSTTIVAGNTETLTATVSPETATDKTVTWSSSNTSVATVSSSGVVTAVAAGSATITVTTNTGSFTATCSVTVTAAPVKYSVTYTPNGGSGSNYVVNNITAGSSHTLVSFATTGFTAPSGKQFKTWSVDGVEKAPGTSITVNANTTVNAIWEDKPSGYTVSFNSNGGSGSMTAVTGVSGSYTLPTCSFTKPSGTTSFAGWSVGSATSSTVYAAGSSITISSNTTLYARWNKTVTYTFTNKSWADSTSSWTSGKDGNGFTANQGVQITTGATGANATTKTSYSLISEIVVRYCTNSKAGVGSIVVQVGSNASKSFSVTKPSSGGTTLKNATFTYSTKQSGAVKVTGNCTTNSVYIWSVKITYIV